MKKNLYSILTTTLYTLVLLWLVDFKILILFDFKIMFVMIIAIALLTLSMKKNKNTDVFKILTWHIIITSTFSTSLLFLKNISISENISNITSIKPMLYGVIYYSIAKVFMSFKEETGDEDSITEENYRHFCLLTGKLLFHHWLLAIIPIRQSLGSCSLQRVR